MKRTLTALLAATLFTACAADSYQRAPMPPQDVEISSPTVARIYVLRMPQHLGTLRTVAVRDNDMEIGRIARSDYLCWERAPGRSLVTLTYEGKEIDGGGNQGLIDLQCEAGEVCYYALTIDEAWRKPVVRLLDKEEGKRLVKDMTPAPKP
jgi:hypothetical protein